MKYVIFIALFALIFAQVPTLGYAFGPFDSKPYLTPTESPQNSININWNTENPESSVVAYGVNLALEDTISISGLRTFHHITLSDLLPSTEYYYKVLPWGVVKQFKTFPSYTDTLTFTAYGDTRSDSAAHQSVINRMAAYEFAFSLHSGDLVNDGDGTDDWRTFFNVEDTVLQDHHFFPTIGNHESPFWPYDTLFVLPEPEDYYSVGFGNAHFIILNTSIDLNGEQRDWLIDDLTTANSDTTIIWIFVNLHRPPYSSGYGHGSQIDVREAWCPLFEQYGVDIVFGGHDHDYERTIPINGVVYIVTGGGGAPLHDVDSSSWTAYSERTYHFCKIDIMEKKLLLKAIKPDGTVFDSLVIDKTMGITEKFQSENYSMAISPNPFVNSVTFSYAVPVIQNVQLRICDSSGRHIKTLVDEPQTPGTYTVIWSSQDESGDVVHPGVYFIVFEYGDKSVKRKIIKID